MLTVEKLKEQLLKLFEDCNGSKTTIPLTNSSMMITQWIIQGATFLVMETNANELYPHERVKEIEKAISARRNYAKYGNFQFFCYGKDEIDLMANVMIEFDHELATLLFL